MKIIKKTLVVLVLCSFIMGTVPISVLAQQNGPENQIFEHEGPDLPDDIQYAPDQIIVKFKAGTSDDTISVINSKNKVVSSEKIIKKKPKAVVNEKTEILKKHGLDMIYLLKLPKNSDVNEMVGKYNKNPYVEYAEPNYKVYVDTTIPNDEHFSVLWGMHNTGQSEGTVDADIDAPEAWDITTGSDTIVVAVIDTGVDYNHKDLDANIWTNPGEIAGDGIDNDGNGYVDDIRGWDFYNNDNNPFDDNGHGTHCSGTIAAEGNNVIGVVGVSWNAKIMPLKFLNRRGSGNTDDAIDAINYATLMGADIMSNSWGGGGESQSLKDAISAANSAGILFVAAAGNVGTDNDESPHYPSSYDVDNIISVAATDRYDNLAGFSCYGLESVDLAAPGVTIASTYPKNRYVYMDGTSMAAPHVSGAAALIMAQNPTISVADLKAKILDSVDSNSALSGKTVTGGRLNVFNCLEANTEPELSITVTSTASSVNEGNIFTVEAAISNLGDETATGINATITLPEGLSTTELPAKTADDILGGDSVTVLWNVTADSKGAYTITVEASATNAAPASGTTTVDVVIPDTEPPVITDITGDTSTTTGDSVDIVVNATDDVGPTSAKIFIDGAAVGIGMTEGPEDTFTYVYTAPSDSIASHTYNVTVYDNAGNFNTSETYAITVTDNDAPIANAGPDQIVVIGNEVTFNGSLSSDNIGVLNYSWDFNATDGISEDAIGETSTHTYSTLGIYTVTLNVSDSVGNTDSDTLKVEVVEEIKTMHIASIDVSFTKTKEAGPNIFGYATAIVTIVNETDDPVQNANVLCHWSDATSDSDSGITNISGVVSLESDTAKVQSGAQFIFTVGNVTHSVFTYNATANVEDQDYIIVP